MKISKALEKGKLSLEKNFIKSANLDTEILLSKILKKDRKFLILNPKKNLDKKNIFDFKNLIDERSKGKPVAYLTGIKNFWKNKFKIKKNVLIPRPDSEIIIEAALKATKNKTNLNILDIGVGSGCLLLSILNDKKGFYGTGIDLSKDCIELSKMNASMLKISKRVKFYKSNVDNFNYGKYDLIISNPPYIKKFKLKYLEKDVFGYEPKLALNGGIDGTSEIKRVIIKSSKLIKKNGMLILEIGLNQKNKVKKLLNNYGFYVNEVLKDLAKNNRCIVSTKI